VITRDSSQADVHYTPNMASPVLMQVASGMTLAAIGRSADTAWLQVILPDQRLAWIFTDLVRANAEYVQALPVTTP
jgi:hypothetical protein